MSDPGQTSTGGTYDSGNDDSADSVSNTPSTGDYDPGDGGGDDE